MTARPLTVDLFCHVVDNFGDIGVCWRLARQLAREKGCAVRLFVDDLVVFAKIAPRIDPSLARQIVADVQVVHWKDRGMPDGYGVPGGLPIGDAVIEAFGCALPGALIDAMAARRPAPVWIDLEYLSAEDWVEGCHAIVSLHPASGLNKTLFFPGFTKRTGGLIRERDLLRERDAFQESVLAQNEWRTRRGLPPVDPDVLDISLFCYPQAPVAELFAGLVGRKARLFVPEGFPLPPAIGPAVVCHYPFVPQEEYDWLLWTCGLNFVRGEDSFVRALWAGRPYVWQIYPQAENAHFVKLEAFLARYTADWPPNCAESLADFTRMWNLGGQKAGAATRFFDDLPALTRLAGTQAEKQARQDDLATQLIRFIESQKG